MAACADRVVFLLLVTLAILFLHEKNPQEAKRTNGRKRTRVESGTTTTTQGVHWGTLLGRIKWETVANMLHWKTEMSNLDSLLQSIGQDNGVQ